MLDKFNEKFPNLLIKYGSQFDITDSGIPNEALLLLIKDQIIGMMTVVAGNYGITLPDFEFTQGPARGAFAAVRGEKIVIGISLPLAQGIIAYFSSAMTRENPYTKLREITYNTSKIEDWWLAGSYSINDIPSEENLVHLSHSLSRLALIYIAGHEIGHIVLGHLNKENPENHWSFDEEGDTSNFDQFCREVGSDRFAAHFLFNYINNLTKFANKYWLFELSMLAVVSLFMYEKPKKDWVEVIENFSDQHPPNQFRALIGQTSMSLTASSEGFISAAKLLVITPKVFEAALEMHEEITGNKRTHEEGSQYAQMLPYLDSLIDFLFKRHRELYPNAGI